MKLKWKIGIGVLVLFAGLAFVSSFFMLGMNNDMMPSWNIDPSSPPNNVDSLLDKMEFATIAFNAPSIINIDDSPQIQLILSLSEAVDEIKQSIIEEGERIGATIRVSDRMEVNTGCYQQTKTLEEHIDVLKRILSDIELPGEVQD